MTSSRNDTGERSGPGKVSTKTKKQKAGVYLLPLAAALPVTAGMILAAYKAWPMVQKLVGLLIRMVVKA